MPKEIIWSPSAEEDLEQIITYLQQHWSNKIAKDFLLLLYKHLDHIADHPGQFPLVYKKRKYRKCVLTKQNTIYYKEAIDAVYLLRIFDTRQHPRKLKLKG
jgi:plasmid stabilization system protein ParE